MNKTIFTWLGIILLLFVAGGFSYYYFVAKPAPPSAPVSKYSSTNTPFSALMASNSDFLTAQNLMRAGDYTGAIASYRKALANTSDPVLLGQIEFKLAVATALSGDKIGAIKRYKEIAANAGNTLVLRAYAVQAIALLYNTTIDRSLTSEIFSDQPYKSFVVPGDDLLSYRHLYEYASSFYPLALPETYIAFWYARHLTTLSTISSTSPQVVSDMAIIKLKLKNADVDIERTRNDPNANGVIPDVLAHKAFTVGALASIGLWSPTDAETAYKLAIATFASFGSPVGSDGYARYFYASFLAHTYGSKRIADIETLLKPLYTDPAHSQYVTTSFFKNVRDKNDYLKKDVQGIARIDSGFKSFLVSLGWKSSDF